MSVGLLDPDAVIARVRELAAIHARAFAAEGARGWSSQEIVTLATRKTCVVFAHELGFLAADAVGEEAEILTIAVEPTAQGRGIGRALMAEALSWMRKNGITRCFLEVAADNATAESLYRSARFRRISRRSGYFSRPDRSVDAIVMEKLLTD